MKVKDTELLKLLLENATGFSITSLERVTHPGEVNDVFIFSTNESRLIARVNESYELSRFEKEKWCIDKAGAIDVKVPKVLVVGRTEDYAYLIESYIEGHRADELTDQSLIWSRVGQYAKAIHGIEVSGFGEDIEDITHGNKDNWSNYLKDNLHVLYAKEEVFMEASGLTVDEAETMQQWFKDLSAKALHFGLSHGDLSLTNIIVNKAGEVNLIDWGAAEAHIVPHYDLGVILEDSLSDDSDSFHKVLQGYEMSYDEFLSLKPEILTVMLLIGVDKLRWAIDKRPELIKQMSTQLMNRYKSRSLVSN